METNSTVWVVDTEDGETYYFSTVEKARVFADEATIDYAKECGLSLAEVTFCEIHPETVA